jgi:hypothetical protein
MNENQPFPKNLQYMIEVDVPLKLYFQQDGSLVLECYQPLFGQTEVLPLHLRFSPPAFAGFAKAIKEKLDAGEITLEVLSNTTLKQ